MKNSKDKPKKNINKINNTKYNIQKGKNNYKQMKQRKKNWNNKLNDSVFMYI